jgi:hypothetical protein
MQSHLSFETSFIRTGGIGMAAVLMTGLSYFCTTIPNIRAQIAGWLGVAFFGLGTVPIAKSLLQGGTRVTFDQTGIHDLRIKGDPFTWNEISYLAIAEVHSQKFLSIYLHAEEQRISKLSAWAQKLCRLNQAMGLSAFNISFAGLTPGLDEAWEYVQTFHPEKTLQTTSQDTQSNVPA